LDYIADYINYLIRDEIHRISVLLRCRPKVYLEHGE
jgi:hypothetical protein